MMPIWLANHNGCWKVGCRYKTHWIVLFIQILFNPGHSSTVLKERRTELSVADWPSGLIRQHKSECTAEEPPRRTPSPTQRQHVPLCWLVGHKRDREVRTNVFFNHVRLIYVQVLLGTAWLQKTVKGGGETTPKIPAWVPWTSRIVC